jgi:hypothetical protein
MAVGRLIVRAYDGTPQIELQECSPRSTGSRIQRQRKASVTGSQHQADLSLNRQRWYIEIGVKKG